MFFNLGTAMNSDRKRHMEIKDFDTSEEYMRLVVYRPKSWKLISLVNYFVLQKHKKIQ